MHASTVELQSINTCPVSGLPILSKPEWIHVGFGLDYRANISVIGSHIIFSQPSGYIRLQGVKKSLDLIDKIIADTVPADQPYVLIEDFSNLRGAAFDARRYFIFNMLNRERLAGLVFCSTSSLFKISVKLGKRLYKDEREIRLANDYTQAVEFALEILSAKNAGPNGSADRTAEVPAAEHTAVSAHSTIANEDWSLNLDGFTTKIEVIDQKVLHSISTGLLDSNHIEPVAKLREKVQKSIIPQGSIEYIIADVTSIKGGNRKARRFYMDSLKHWHQIHPLRMYIFYGANRFMQAASNLARPFMPFKIRIASNLDQALKIVAKDQIEKKNQSSPTASVDAATRDRENDLIQKYADELQQLLGIIDWERDGLDELAHPDSSHPFASVYESIALIKSELDELIQDKNKAEKALRHAKDELEVQVNLRTAELENANKELRAEIRERKIIEVELKNAKLLAESANRAKSDFLANMSHELRTPLNHIIGFTQLILDKKFGDLNQIQEEYLIDVEDSSRHLLSLINDILDLSKIEAGKMEIEPCIVDLPTLLENSVLMFKEKAMKNSVKLSLSIKDVAETVTVDERKLKQILYNLLANAIKFTPDGGNIWLTAQSCDVDDTRDPESADHPNKDVKISVSDTGIGLKPEDLNLIFSPFEQVDSSIDRRFNGTGLGLSLTKQFVELHGGRLWAESAGEGKGSSFHFTLPV